LGDVGREQATGILSPVDSRAVSTASLKGVQSRANRKELMSRLGHASPDAALRYQHATSDRDAALTHALSELAEGAELSRFPISARDVRAMNAIEARELEEKTVLTCMCEESGRHESGRRCLRERATVCN
jgi:hypothetical protein